MTNTGGMRAGRGKPSKNTGYLDSGEALYGFVFRKRCWF